MGAAGAVPTVLPEFMRRPPAQGNMDLCLDLLHRSWPSKVLTPPRLLGAMTRSTLIPASDFWPGGITDMSGRSSGGIATGDAARLA